MNLEYLSSFVEIVKWNSISKASKELFVTQSALSQQISSIEKSLGVKLFERSNKGVKLTNEGNIVFNYAESLVNLYENMQKDIESLKNSDIKIIRISSCSSVSEYLIPCTIHMYKEKHNVNFTLKTKNNKDIVKDILDKTSDVGFTDEKIDDKKIECFYICDNPLIFIYSPQNRKINSSSVNIESIKEMRFILSQKESGYRKTLEYIFMKNGFSLKDFNVDMEFDTIESIKISVMANLGVSIVPYSTVKKELYTGVLKSAQLENIKLNNNIYIIHDQERIEQKHINDFISYIKKYGNKTFC